MRKAFSGYGLVDRALIDSKNPSESSLASFPIATAIPPPTPHDGIFGENLSRFIMPDIVARGAKIDLENFGYSGSSHAELPIEFDCNERILRRRSCVAISLQSPFLCRILHVVFGGSQKKMFWIAARPIIAMMANLKSFWNWSVSVNISGSMSAPRRSLHLTIASGRVDVASPRPTFVGRWLGYKIPKSFFFSSNLIPFRFGTKFATCNVTFVGSHFEKFAHLLKGGQPCR